MDKSLHFERFSANQTCVAPLLLIRATLGFNPNELHMVYQNYKQLNNYYGQRGMRDPKTAVEACLFYHVSYCY